MSSSEKQTNSKQTQAIRILDENDLEIFLALRLKGLKESPSSFGADHSEWLTVPLTEVAKRMGNDANGFVLGAFDESPVPEHDELDSNSPEIKVATTTLVGIAGFRRQKGIKVRHTGSIWGVYVDVPNRGTGVGKALMVDMIARARDIDGLERLTLTVTSHNQSALALYKNLSFKQYGLEPKALKIDGQYFDETLMVLDLC